MKSTLIIISFLLSIEAFSCECSHSKGFLGNIEFSDIVIYGQVVDSITSGNGSVIYNEKIGVRVINSFGANRENDTIWILDGSGIDCNAFISELVQGKYYYFALNKYQEDNYVIRICGAHFLATDLIKNKAIGVINQKDKIISDVKAFFGSTRLHNNHMNLSNLNRKIEKRCK